MLGSTRNNIAPDNHSRVQETLTFVHSIAKLLWQEWTASLSLHCISDSTCELVHSHCAQWLEPKMVGGRCHTLLSLLIANMNTLNMNTGNIKGKYFKTFLRRCCIMASIAVIWARISDEVYITSTGMLHILFPASIASSTPLGVRGTSTHPVNRFFSFHNDSPCRIRMSALSPTRAWQQSYNISESMFRRTILWPLCCSVELNLRTYQISLELRHF